MSLDQNIDELIGHWHDLTEQKQDDIEASYESDGVQLVNLIQRQFLGEFNVAEFKSAKQFSEFVLALRQNERLWSRRLGEVLLQSDSSLINKDFSSAQNILKDFESKCPWLNFVDIAKSQRLKI